MKKEFKIGDKVFDPRYGWGEVLDIGSTGHYLYPVKVTFRIVEGNILRTYTEDGHSYTKPSLYHHNPFNTDKRVVLVSNDGKAWFKRALLAETDGVFWCYNNAETITEIDNITQANKWKFMKELPSKITLTEEEIREKFDIDDNTEFEIK